MSMLNSRNTFILRDVHRTDSVLFRHSVIRSVLAYWYRRDIPDPIHTANAKSPKKSITDKHNVCTLITNYLASDLLLDKGQTHTLAANATYAFHTLFLDKNATLSITPAVPPVDKDESEAKDDDDNDSPEQWVVLIVYNKLILNKLARIIVPARCRLCISCFGVFLNRGVLQVGEQRNVLSYKSRMHDIQNKHSSSYSASSLPSCELTLSYDMLDMQIGALYVDDITAQLAALKYLSHHYRDQFAARLVHSGLVHRLMYFMRESRSHRLQFEASQLIATCPGLLQLSVAMVRALLRVAYSPMIAAQQNIVHILAALFEKKFFTFFLSEARASNSNFCYHDELRLLMLDQRVLRALLFVCCEAPHRVSLSLSRFSHKIHLYAGVSRLLLLLCTRPCSGGGSGGGDSVTSYVPDVARKHFPALLKVCHELSTIRHQETLENTFRVFAWIAQLQSQWQLQTQSQTYLASGASIVLHADQYCRAYNSVYNGFLIQRWIDEQRENMYEIPATVQRLIIAYSPVFDVELRQNAVLDAIANLFTYRSDAIKSIAFTPLYDVVRSSRSQCAYFLQHDLHMVPAMFVLVQDTESLEHASSTALLLRILDALHCMYACAPQQLCAAIELCGGNFMLEEVCSLTEVSTETLELFMRVCWFLLLMARCSQNAVLYYAVHLAAMENILQFIRSDVYVDSRRRVCSKAFEANTANIDKLCDFVRFAEDERLQCESAAVLVRLQSAECSNEEMRFMAQRGQRHARRKQQYQQQMEKTMEEEKEEEKAMELDDDDDDDVVVVDMMTAGMDMEMDLELTVDTYTVDEDEDDVFVIDMDGFIGYEFDEIRMYSEWCFGADLAKRLDGVHYLRLLSSNMELRELTKMSKLGLLARLQQFLQFPQIKLRVQSSLILLNVLHLIPDHYTFLGETVIALFEVVASPQCTITNIVTPSSEMDVVFDIVYDGAYVDTTKMKSFIDLLHQCVYNAQFVRNAQSERILLLTAQCMRMFTDICTWRCQPVLNDTIIAQLLKIYQWDHAPLQSEIYSILRDTQQFSTEELRYAQVADLSTHSHSHSHKHLRVSSVVAVVVDEVGTRGDEWVVGAEYEQSHIDKSKVNVSAFAQFPTLDMVQVSLNEVFADSQVLIRRGMNFLYQQYKQNSKHASACDVVFHDATQKMTERLLNARLDIRCTELLKEWPYFNFTDLTLQHQSKWMQQQLVPFVAMDEIRSISAHKFYLTPTAIACLISVIATHQRVRHDDYEARTVIQKNALCALGDILMDYGPDAIARAYECGVMELLFEMIGETRYIGCNSDVFKASTWILATVCNHPLIATPKYLVCALKALNKIMDYQRLYVYVTYQTLFEDACWAYSYLTDHIDVEILMRHEDYLREHDARQNQLLVTGYLKQLQTLRQQHHAMQMQMQEREDEEKEKRAVSAVWNSQVVDCEQQQRCGDTIVLRSGKKGVVRFVGSVHFASGVWIGVQLVGDEPGVHDGVVRGVRYFTCPPQKGVFIKQSSSNQAVNTASLSSISSSLLSQHSSQSQSPQPAQPSASPRSQADPDLQHWPPSPPLCAHENENETENDENVDANVQDAAWDAQRYAADVKHLSMDVLQAELCATEVQIEQQFEVERYQQMASKPDAPYCICQRVMQATDNMIVCVYCDEWYHVSCLGLDVDGVTAEQRLRYKCPICCGEDICANGAAYGLDGSKHSENKEATFGFDLTKSVPDPHKTPPKTMVFDSGFDSIGWHTKTQNIEFGDVSDVNVFSVFGCSAQEERKENTNELQQLLPIATTKTHQNQFDFGWEFGLVNDDDALLPSRVVDMAATLYGAGTQETYACPLRKLLSSLLNSNEGIRVPSLRAIRNIISKSTPATRWLLQQGLLPSLIRVVAYELSPLIRADVWWTMSMIMTQHGDMVQSFMDEPQAMRVLLQCLSNDTFEVKQESFAVLMHLLENASELQSEELFNRYNVVLRVFEFMQCIECSHSGEQQFAFNGGGDNGVGVCGEDDALLNAVEVAHKMLLRVHRWKCNYGYRYYVEHHTLTATVWKCCAQIRDEKIQRKLQHLMHLYFADTIDSGYGAFE